MRKTLWEKRIPTFLGLFLVVLAIGATTLLTQYGRAIFTKANTTQAPKDIKVTNITDGSFTITWLSDDNTIGSIITTEGSNPQKTILDDQDQLADKTTGRKVHSATVTGLKPNTKYSYQILSAGSLYNNNGSLYSLTTAQTKTPDNRKDITAEGSIVLSTGAPGAGTIVFLNIQGTQLLSTIVKDSGSYLLSLSLIRTIDLANFYNPSDNDILELTMVGPDLTISKVRTFFKNRSKIPSMTLGKDYDFTLNLPSPSPTEGASSSLFVAPKTPAGGIPPAILSPKKDESFTDQTPAFKGTAPSGAKLKITIESNNLIEDTITAGSDGSWSYKPKAPLAPGIHKITVTVPDQSGIIRILTQTFTVLAPGSQVVEAATPSATPTVKLSPSPTSSPSASPTITPTATATPKLTVSPSPTLIPTPVFKGGVTAVPTAPPIPQSATILPSLVFGSFGILLFLLGFSLLIVKK